MEAGVRKRRLALTDSQRKRGDEVNARLAQMRLDVLFSERQHPNKANSPRSGLSLVYIVRTVRGAQLGTQMSRNTR